MSTTKRDRGVIFAKWWNYNLWGKLYNRWSAVDPYYNIYILWATNAPTYAHAHTQTASLIAADTPWITYIHTAVVYLHSHIIHIRILLTCTHPLYSYMRKISIIYIHMYRIYVRILLKISHYLWQNPSSILYMHHHIYIRILLKVSHYLWLLVRGGCPTMSRHARLSQLLGSVTRLCVIDKEGILAEVCVYAWLCMLVCVYAWLRMLVYVYAWLCVLVCMC